MCHISLVTHSSIASIRKLSSLVHSRTMILHLHHTNVHPSPSNHANDISWLTENQGGEENLVISVMVGMLNNGSSLRLPPSVSKRSIYDYSLCILFMCLYQWRHSKLEKYQDSLSNFILSLKQKSAYFFNTAEILSRVSIHTHMPCYAHTYRAFCCSK